jgi:type IV pilus assembly protein PilP
MAATRQLGVISLSLGILFYLSGCTETPDDETKEFVKEAKAITPSKIEPLPQFVAYVPAAYYGIGLRSPFEPASTLVSKPNATVYPEQTHPIARPRELLEAYMLDALKMVGTLERNGEYTALLKDANGIIHQVKVGNYVGQNLGKIEVITENEIEVKESVPVHQGGWISRNVLIRFSK